jgi:hypothetical protein
VVNVDAEMASSSHRFCRSQATACNRIRLRLHAIMVSMRTDPTDLGGLFIGRRPRTGPIHYRTLPTSGSRLRQRIDGSFAALILLAMITVSLICWGPIPIACLWIGSQVAYSSDSMFLGIGVAFIALFPFLFAALSLLRQLDYAWLLVRRAAGHDQRTGTMVRIFATTAAACALAFAFWLLVIHGLEPRGANTP